MTRIYTKSGDKGETGLHNGERVSKSSDRIEAIGSIDELNSFIGLSMSSVMPVIIRDALHKVQHILFDIGGELAHPGMKIIPESKVKDLEHCIDDLSTRLDILREFILPGGYKTASQLHVARSICRRAERNCIALEHINPTTLQYLNRLSDLLFTMARYLNACEGYKDVVWKKDDS
jgi:cob(I)alamin adenosyltransferase